MRIGNHGKGNLKLVFERSGFLRSPQADEDDPGTEPLKPVFLLAQLRHLLSAEGSPVMAQKNQHQRPVFPEPTEPRDRIVPQHHLLIPDFGYRHGLYISSLIVDCLAEGPGDCLLSKPAGLSTVGPLLTGNENNMKKDDEKVKGAAGCLACDNC